MINSIQQFCEDGARKISDIFGTYANDMSKIAEMVYGVTDVVTKLGEKGTVLFSPFSQANKNDPSHGHCGLRFQSLSKRSFQGTGRITEVF